jgi:hypothetical protein
MFLCLLVILYHYDALTLQMYYNNTLVQNVFC